MENYNHIPFKSHSIFGFILVSTLLLMFSACSGPKTINVNVEGAPQMNQSQACVVYIYQLSNDTNFMQATLDTFWQEGVQAFQKDLVEDEIKIQLIPGEAKTYELNISDKTKFIGAAADFYNPDKEGWRDIFSLASKVPKTITVFVKFNKIEISY